MVVMLGTGLRANSSVRHLHHALIPRVPSAQRPRKDATTGFNLLANALSVPSGLPSK